MHEYGWNKTYISVQVSRTQSEPSENQQVARRVDEFMHGRTAGITILSNCGRAIHSTHIYYRYPGHADFAVRVLERFLSHVDGLDIGGFSGGLWHKHVCTKAWHWS